MASKIFPPYTTSEAQNLALGQAGAFYCNTTGAITLSEGVIIAITFIADSTFASLTSEDDHKGNDAWPNTAAATSTHASAGSDAVGTSDTFPAGVTIYGRWTAFELGSGSKVIAYMGS